MMMNHWLRIQNQNQNIVLIFVIMDAWTLFIILYDNCEVVLIDP